MDFWDFLSLFPERKKSDKFEIQPKRRNSVSSGKNIEGFVPPSLTEIEHALDTPQVVIVSAAGAVGKSTLASQLTFNRNAIKWDLSNEEPVASYALDGMLSSAIGIASLGELFSDLAAGHFVIVIDALDEARMKATSNSFESFIDNVAELALKTDKTSCVLFGRTQSAELTYLLLLERKVRSSLFSIDPFDVEAANTYIDNKIEHYKPPPLEAIRLMKSHRDNYLLAKKTILSKLGEAVSANYDDQWTNKDVRGFLGYAPILDAVSYLLMNSRNYEKLIGELGGLDEKSYQWPTRVAEILSRMIDWILIRESKDKLQNIIKPQLRGLAEKHGWDCWDNLYTTDEQCARLLARILNQGEESIVLSLYERNIPDEIVEKYEEMIKIWSEDHPFLKEGSVPASVVFQSYLFAVGLLKDYGGFSKSIYLYMLSSRYKANRLFADFYLFLSADKTSGALSITPDHLGQIFRSFASAENADSYAALLIEGAAPDDSDDDFTASCEISVCGKKKSRTSEDARDEATNVLSFVCDIPPETELVFEDSLRNSTITAPCIVSLGPGASTIEIGPNVWVHCRVLNIQSESIAFRIPDMNDINEDPTVGVTLRSESRPSTNIVNKPVVRGPAAGLNVSWPGSEAFPWTAYSRVKEGGKKNGWSWRQLESYRRFRRIAMTFRSHKKGSLARFKDKIESERVLRGAIGEAMRKSLLNDGVISLKNSFYYWNSDKADFHLGVSWQQLRNGELSEKLEGYISDFCSRNKSLFA